MPEEDGYSFVRRVRSLTASSGVSIPSIALTAYTRGVDRTKALAAGFTTHISKPVNPDDLVAAVANLAPFAVR
jgi:CheY-like chemotaxis protein